MSNTDDDHVGDILKLIRDVAGQSLENPLWILRQYGELRQRISSGEWDEHWVNEQYAQYTAERGPRFRKRLADLGAAYQQALTDLSREWSEQFCARLEAVAGGRSPDAAVSAPAEAAPPSGPGETAPPSGPGETAPPTGTGETSAEALDNGTAE